MEKKEKTYTSAPLPFQGQKRRHAQKFSNIIKTINPDVVIDLFGGSGLLAHLAKRANPRSRVIYNDYDNYSKRLEYSIETNKLLRYFRDLLKDIPAEKKITGELRDVILQKLETENKKGYVDWITMSSSLMFSMKYATNYEDFKKNTFYNCVRTSDYVTTGYLDGLEIVRVDYRELCKQYRGISGVLFIADPPYLSTDVSTYGSAEYWKLKDYLDVLSELSGLNFIYFTSEKSQIIELCEWLEINEGKVRNIFKGMNISEVKSNTGGKNSYTDIMLYKLLNAA